MEKYYEEFKEILEDQIKKIVKKGDISPQELESVYKASAIVLDIETQKAMKKAEEQQKKQEEGGQSQQGSQASNAGNSRRSYGSYAQGQSNGSYEGGQSNHYPWFMYQNEGGSNAGNSGNSYGPIWNQDKEMMREQEMMEQMSNARGRNSRNMSNERSNARGNSRGNSNESYEGAYAGAYEGAYDGAYDSYENSNEGSYRRGRSPRTGRYVSRDNYSRAMEKERMIGKLEDMMDDAPSEKERKVLEQCVERLERQ